MTSDLMTADEARASVNRAKCSLEAAANEVVQQITGKAWIALGYASWDEMREAEYSGAAVIVPRADRPQLSARLASEGLSQQQIGATLGVSQQTIGRDVIHLDNVSDDPGDDAPPTRTDSLGRKQPRSKPRAVPPRPAPPAPPRFPSSSSPVLPGTEDVADAGIVVDDAALDDEPLLDAIERRQPGARAEVDRARIRARWSRAVASLADIPLLDPEQVSAAIGDAEINVAEATLASAAQWFKRLRSTRSGLRVVNGGGK